MIFRRKDSRWKTRNSHLTRKTSSLLWQSKKNGLVWGSSCVQNAAVRHSTRTWHVFAMYRKIIKLTQGKDISFQSDKHFSTNTLFTEFTRPQIKRGERLTGIRSTSAPAQTVNMLHHVQAPLLRTSMQNTLPLTMRRTYMAGCGPLS